MRRTDPFFWKMFGAWALIVIGLALFIIAFYGKGQ